MYIYIFFSVQLSFEFHVIVILLLYLTVLWKKPGTETPPIVLQDEIPLKSSQNYDNLKKQ